MSPTGSASTGGPDPASLRGRRRMVRVVVIVGLILFAVLQLVPYGRAHSNPPVTARVEWDSPRTETLVRGACFDCHSHETRWPWYSHIAPLSWLVERDVGEGREELNFSTGNLHEIEEVADLIREGEMPLWFYRPLHSVARLSDEEKGELLSGLRETFPDLLDGAHGDEDSDH